jgi:hypothetical protein
MSLPHDIKKIAVGMYSADRYPIRFKRSRTANLWRMLKIPLATVAATNRVPEANFALAQGRRCLQGPRR